MRERMRLSGNGMNGRLRNLFDRIKSRQKKDPLDLTIGGRESFWDRVLSDRMRAILARIRVLAIPIVAGVFLFIYIAMGLIYFNEGSDQDSLRDQITQKENILSVPVVISAELQSDYDNALQVINQEYTRNEIKYVVLDIAAANGFYTGIDTTEINIFGFLDEGEEKIGQSTFEKTSFTVTVTGGQQQVLDFIGDLDDTERLETMVLDTLSIGWGQSPTTAHMKYIVYTKVE